MTRPAHVVICRRCGGNVEDWRTVCDSPGHREIRDAIIEAREIARSRT